MKKSSGAEQQSYLQRRPIIKRLFQAREIGVLGALVILAIIMSFASPYFLKATNIFNVLRGMSTIGIMSIGMTMVIITGGMLTESPPSSQRLVIAIPAVALLVAIGLEQTVRLLQRLLGFRRDWENVAELGLAEMAAFSGGGGYAASGPVQAKYRAFFKRHPELFDGWQPAAPEAVVASPAAACAPDPSWPSQIASYRLGAIKRNWVSSIGQAMYWMLCTRLPWVMSCRLADAVLGLVNDFSIHFSTAKVGTPSTPGLLSS